MTKYTLIREFIEHTGYKIAFVNIDRPHTDFEKLVVLLPKTIRYKEKELETALFLERVNISKRKR